MLYKKETLYAATIRKAKRLWSDTKYEWKYGPVKKEQPPGLLTRSFRKAVLGTAGVSILALGMSLMCGNWMERAYRGFGGDPHKLDLTLDTAKADNTVAPLYVGSAEVKRIIAMQEDLLTLGYPLSSCGANGEFQKQDKIAVNWFRASMGLPSDDFVDQRTLKALHEQAEHRRSLNRSVRSEFDDASTNDAVLRKSFVNPSLSEKARIREVQADLYQLGYPIGACKMNGVMNDDIVKDVIKFQETQPGMLPTGEVDYKTGKLLEAATHRSLVASGQLDNAKAQGLDDMTAIVYGQQMSPDELDILAEKYIRKGAPKYVVDAVVDATKKAGFDFNYLMDLASHESGYKPWVGAGTSSAYGNFQFTDSTWLTVFKTYGEKYGYGDLTKRIQGNHIVGATPQEAKYIMDLRSDPKVAALMAIELSKANLAYLQSNLGGAVSKTDLYIAHFLGPGGGLTFVKQFRRDNTQDAAKMFPDAAAANLTIFYENGNPQGRHTTLGEIYSRFARSMTGSQVLRMVAVPPAPPKKSAANIPAAKASAPV